MNTDTIICPNCKTEIALTDAVTHTIREDLQRQFADRQRQLQQSLNQREQNLNEQRQLVEEARQSVEQQVADKLAAERTKLLASARQMAEQQLSVEMQDLRTQLTDRNQKLQEAQGAELKLRQQQRALEERQETLQLEVTRKVDEERGKVREEARKAAVEAERLKLAEKEKVISDLQREIQNLKQKAEQGSVQLQGEVLELDLETGLAAQFPFDSIEPVAKGQRGADVLQRVRTNIGYECGGILWETKRAKNWSKDWPAKLKEDQRTSKAELAVLVSEVLPPTVDGFGWFDGVWLCDVTSAMPLAVALRQGLVTAAVTRQHGEGRHGKMEQLFGYFTSPEFRQRIEGIVEAFKAMGEDLEAEKRALQKHWARREKQIGQAILHTASLYGSVQGIVGQGALPDIEPLRLEAAVGNQNEN